MQRRKQNFKEDMMYRKYTMYALSAVLMTGCSAQTAAASDTEQVNLSAQTEPVSVTQADTDSALNVVCNGKEVTADSSSVSAEQGKVTISAPGTYVFSGKLDGSIIVSSTGKGDVNLVFAGIDITAAENAAVFVQEADNTVITVREGTVNTLSDASSYILNEDEEPTAAVFSKDDLVICGSGKLIVNGNYNDGITGKDDLQIHDVSLEVMASDDGIVGKDSLTIDNASLKITAGGDGLKASNDSEEGKGTILIESGTVEITSGDDGMQSVTSTVINGGDITIKAGEGASAAVHKENGFGGYAPWGNGFSDMQTEDDSTEKQKGITSEGTIEINGGSIVIDSTDDALNSAGTIQINDGTLEISAGDDAVHADESLTIENGTVHVLTCLEGLESRNIVLNDGTTDIKALDDGINASDPDVKESMMSDGSSLQINGGNITIDSDGDGLDSNGDVVMNGGYVIVYGPENNGNGALDYAGSFTVTGGTLLAGGSAGMLQVPSTSGNAYTVTVNANGASEITIRSNNETIAEYSSDKKFASLVVCSDAFSAGETVSVYQGETLLQEVQVSQGTGNSGNMMMPGGMGMPEGGMGMPGGFGENGMPEDGQGFGGGMPQNGQGMPGQGPGGFGGHGH